MHAYLSVKFEGDDNQELIEQLCTAAERAGLTVACTNRDYDDYGRRESSEPLTAFMFEGIERADLVLLEVTDRGIGQGIEAGYAAANQVPVILLATSDADLSPTLRDLATEIIEYHGFEDLTQQLGALKSSLG